MAQRMITPPNEEDVPDTRESPATGIVGDLKEFGVENVRGVMGDKPVLVDVRGMFEEDETKMESGLIRTYHEYKI